MSYACSEYDSLSRRGFLAGAATLAGAAAAPAWVPKIRQASWMPSKRDVLISVYLRGGIDGLSALVPFLEPNYYASRPNIAIAPPDSSNPNRAINLNGQFGLAPALAPLLEPYQAGWLAFLHAVGSPNWSRSHFDAQRWMEVGIRGDTVTTTGWLGRHLASVAPMKQKAILRGISMTYGMRQTMSGAPQTLPVPDPENFGYSGWWWDEGEITQAIHRSYERADDPLRTAAFHTQRTISLLDSIDFVNYQPAGGAIYPDHAFGKSLKSTAALMKADLGVEAFHIDYDGWDTHSDQAPIDGQMFQLMDVLGKGLNAIWKDLAGSNMGNWTLVLLSEFGRNVMENSSKGTDHGFGNIAMVMGGAVNGGQVVTQWPGIAPEQLVDGMDLGATIDHRDILSEVMALRCGNTQNYTLFPNFRPRYRNLVRPYRR